MLLVFIGGCARMPELTRDEWLAVTTRTYEGATQDEAFAAVEQVFRLADPEDYRIQHTPDGLIAHRQWLVYFVIGAAVGTDIWTVTAKQDTTGVRVSAHVTTAANTLTAVAAPTTTGGTTASPVTIPGNAIPVQSTAIYDLFWARVGYLMGQRDTWMSCKTADKRSDEGITFGHTEPLCQIMTTKRTAPEGAIVD